MTPMMMQWEACKKEAKDAILLFRLGDFYEAFHEDAKLLSEELDLTLTKRQETPMSGIPQQTLETYLDRLIAKGHKVAVAEQTEDPKMTKGIVKREIVRFVTPGTVITSNLLADKQNNYIASITKLNTSYGLAFLDLTTATFRVIELSDLHSLFDELYRMNPSELIISKKCHDPLLDELSCKAHIREEWHFDHRSSLDALLRHFNVHNLDGFGLQGMVAGINAAGALLSYVQDELKISLNHIQTIEPQSLSTFMTLDHATQKHLELSDTFLSLLDHTSTPMGGRLLKEWINYPLLSPEKINERQDAIACFIDTKPNLPLKQVRDLQRLMTRISTRYATPRDLIALASSLSQIPTIAKQIAPLTSPLLQKQRTSLHNLSELSSLITFALNEEGAFNSGYNSELDELKTLTTNSKQWLANYQIDLRQELNIKTLKIGYTKVFGYYIEVSRGQSDKMPINFERKQTLVNSERFISHKLKEYEVKMFSAQEQIERLEKELFEELCAKTQTYEQQVKEIASAIAHIDVLLSLAHIATTRRFTRPIVDDSDTFTIHDGRHPVIEAALPLAQFIPNDIFLNEQERLILITGPNMAGKSTYLRQAALIAILAHMGSYVPATSAHIGIIDKVFSRIGASDDLNRGKSTFMVEMTETANILNNATPRSLIILDEIGRGTSTYDGISIAWAVIDYLMNTPNKRAKTLFATHYWELTHLEKEIPGVINYHVTVHEHDETITFLHKIIRGETDKSYGIHVARLAGLPPIMIRKAKEILAKMESTSYQPPAKKNNQLFLFDVPTQDNTEILNEIKELDLDNLTPIEALQKLTSIQSRL